MRAFVRLFEELDQTNKTNEKVAALCRFLEKAEQADQLWGIGLLYGKRPKRTVNSRRLQEWAAEQSGLPDWLFQETYHSVGDLAETIARILPEPEQYTEQSLADWMQQIMALQNQEEADRKTFVLAAWQSLSGTERLVFNKLLSGGFRVGVSQKLVVKALARTTGMAENDIAFRLTGQWTPWTHTLQDLLAEENLAADLSKPYPFYLAHGLDTAEEELGSVGDWQMEYKWDGIRAQLIQREGQTFLWSRGEELLTERFPELETLGALLPSGTAIDGELLAFKDEILPFQKLQTRISRKNVGKKTLEEAPAVLRAYDLLEWKGRDIRQEPLVKRRELLEQLYAQTSSPALQISDLLQVASWEEARVLRGQSRAQLAEGLMLKHRQSAYEQGRKRGHWWKWKVEPLHIDAVMIYAMKGHGQRSNLYTDYTFAVWNGDELVPFTKAYSGLTMAEFKAVDQFVKAHTRERFGPVRSVDPELVFEIAFEGIQASSRHKSGIALRFPRMARWRQDKKAQEAGTLEELQLLLKQFGS